LLLVKAVASAREGEIFGQTVRQLRLERGWTQEDLADAAGLTATYVGQVERGDKVPSLTVVLKLARGLSTTPSEMLKTFSTAVLRQLKL
jgi:transcriptional regulator with XRE-family HTH domain